MHTTRAITTKINLATYHEIKKIAQKANLTIYNLLQVVIDSYIKLLSKDSIITDDLKSVVSNFAPIKISDKSFTLSEPNTSKFTCSRCIAIINKSNTHTSQAVLLKQKDCKEEIITNRNNDDILKEILNVYDTSLIRELDKIRKAENFLSITEALRFAILQASNSSHTTIEEEIREMFCDNERGDFGEVIDYDAAGKYKRSLHREIK